MRPACAICILPFSGSQSFVLVGTEAVHRACAANGGKTRLQKIEEQVEALGVSVAQGARQARELTITHERLTGENLSLTRQLANEREAKVDMANALLVAQDQRREAMAECSRLREELARARDVEEESPAPERADGAVVMFSLLELD